MVTSKLQGGIGNQMFQIATAHSLALLNNDNSAFNFNDCFTPAQGNTSNKYKNNIFKNINEISDYEGLTTIYSEPNFSYNKILYTPNLILSGYFQSELYFKEHKKNISDLFFINPIHVKGINNHFKLAGKKTVSIHVRRGDYLNNPDFHQPCSLEYYKEAISIFDKDYYFIFISDDIKWCKENFIGDKYIFSDLDDDIFDFTLLTICNHNIIANSSFSWWGAFLNKNINKKVIAPKQWFGNNPNTPKDTQDIYCENWIKI